MQRRSGRAMSPGIFNRACAVTGMTRVYGEIVGCFLSAGPPSPFCEPLFDIPPALGPESSVQLFRVLRMR